MAITEAKKRANRKYDAANYEKVIFLARKGLREKYKAYAEAAGLSTAAFIRTAIEEKAEREGLKTGE